MRPMEKTIGWFEIPVNNMKRAKQFYGSIFNIEFQDMEFRNGLKMALFPAAATAVGGALCEYPDFYKTGQTGVLIYFSANPDLQTTLDRIIMHEGRVIIPKTLISEEYGFMAIFEDTEGNKLALHSTK
jgi:uncharacterized protein